MKSVGLFEAKSHFSALIHEVEGGASIVVTKKGKPVARIVPFVDPAQPREFGFDEGGIWMADDFNDLPPEIAAAFGRREILTRHASDAVAPRRAKEDRSKAPRDAC